MSAVISARNLSKRYGKGKPAVDSISFEIPAGRIVGLIGPNGSGKTTTLKAALGRLLVLPGCLGAPLGCSGGAFEDRFGSCRVAWAGLGGPEGGLEGTLGVPWVCWSAPISIDFERLR